MRVIFFAGKGGVGKSTIAAASAWQLASEFRVRLVSLDPAHNLGDIFRRQVGKGGVWLSDHLLVEEVDLKERTKVYLDREMSLLKETYSYLQVLDLDRYFSLLQYSPGIEEYCLLLAMEESIRSSEKFDYVMFDTPPTGLTLRFLALPSITLSWIERLVVIRRRILEKRETISKISRVAGEVEYREDGIMRRLVELKERHEKMLKLLNSENCGVVLVFNPDPLSVKEAMRLLEGLKTIGLRVNLCLQNKVRAEDGEIAQRTEKEITPYVPEGTKFFRVKWENGISQDTNYPLYELKTDLITPLLASGERS